MKSQKFPVGLIPGLVGSACITAPAYAYADPNPVGLISQVLTPLLITVGACVTFFRNSLLLVFGRMWRRVRGGADA